MKEPVIVDTGYWIALFDCASFVIMQERGIRKYAGFDDHFKQMGFICALE